jgi:hypothetical protein
MARPIHLLHVFPTFDPGGAQVRTVTLMNQLGEDFAHTILSLNGSRGAAAWIAPERAVRMAEPPPKNAGVGYILALRRLIGGVKPDVTVTYNWGAIDGVMAALSRFCPVIHTEDGFGPDEANGLIPAGTGVGLPHAIRNWAERSNLRVHRTPASGEESRDDDRSVPAGGNSAGAPGAGG